MPRGIYDRKDAERCIDLGVKCANPLCHNLIWRVHDASKFCDEVCKDDASVYQHRFNRQVKVAKPDGRKLIQKYERYYWHNLYPETRLDIDAEDYLFFGKTV